MERNKSRKIFEELKHENELDMVPTREKESAKKGTVPKKYQLKDHPIFFKGTKIQSTLNRINSLNNTSKKGKPKVKSEQ